MILQTNQDAWCTPALKFYGVDLAPLKVTAKNAVILLTERETIMMCTVAFGKGRVVAPGAPWLYNEYLYTQDNRRIAEELFRKLLE